MIFLIKDYEQVYKEVLIILYSLCAFKFFKADNKNNTNSVRKKNHKTYFGAGFIISAVKPWADFTQCAANDIDCCIIMKVTINQTGDQGIAHLKYK